MLRQAYRKLRLFLKLDRPGCQIVSKEVLDYLDEPANPGFMGQNKQPVIKPVAENPQANADLLCQRQTSSLGMLNRPKATAEVEEIVDQVRDAFYGRTKPTSIGPELGLDLRGRLIMGAIGDPPTFETPEELESYLTNKLTPQLVVDNTGKTTDQRTYGEEPPMLDPACKRRLSMAWLNWCAGMYNLNHKDAWAIGAKSMIDSEFDGKMRENVEILPWEITDPCTVNIRYHDKVLFPNDPWFDKESDDE